MPWKTRQVFRVLPYCSTSATAPCSPVPSEGLSHALPVTPCSARWFGLFPSHRAVLSARKQLWFPVITCFKPNPLPVSFQRHISCFQSNAEDPQKLWQRGWRCTTAPEGSHRCISQKRDTHSVNQIREVIFNVSHGVDWGLGIDNLKNPEFQMMPQRKKKKKSLEVSPVLNKKSIVDLTLYYGMWPHNEIIWLIYDYKHLNYVLLGHVWFSVSCKAANLCIIPLNSSGYKSNTKVFFLKVFGIIPKFKYVSMTHFESALTHYKMLIYNTLFWIMSSLFSGFCLGGGGFLFCFVEFLVLFAFFSSPL